MPEPQVLVSGEPRKHVRSAPAPAPAEAWRWIGWLGLALLVVGVGDTLLAFVPFRLGNSEWEFGTVAATFAGLPLVTMGFAASLGAATALGSRWAIVTLSWMVLVWGTLVVAGLLLFMTDVPLALRTVAGDAQIGIRKAVAKTVMLGVVFGGVYFITGVGSLRRLRDRPPLRPLPGETGPAT